jgi:hypothetical protein
VHPQRSRRRRTRRGRRTLHRATNSVSVKRKSPTSASRRSMSSTRRTRARFEAWYRKPAAAAAEAAEGAEGAEVAEAAEVAADAELAAQLAITEAAVCRGELAAFARRDCFPITLTNTGRHGRVRQGRPGQSMYYLQWCPRPCVGSPRMTAGWVSKPYREMPACELDEEFQWSINTALRRRAGVAGKVRVLTS